MSLSNAAETDLLKLLFMNTSWALYGDTIGIVGSGSAGSLYLALHTANPGATGNQSTSEATYTSYARTAISRASGSWTISGAAPTQIANTGTVTAPTSTGGSNVITYFSLGLGSAGATEILCSGVLSASLTVTTGIAPIFAPGSLIVTAN